MAAAQFVVQNVLVDEVFVDGDRRALNEAAVASLVESIKSIGLQTPITVRGDDTIADPDTGEVIGGYALVAGRHRLEACRALGYERIPAVVRECDEIDAELWEIDENLCRSELTEAEEARCLARRKQLWEERKKRQSGQNVPIESKREDGKGHRKKGFAAETAAVTGEDKRTVNRKIARATAIDPDVLDAITGGKWDKGVVLDILKKLTHAEQRQALARVQSGSSPSFADAYDFIRGEDAAPKAKPVPKPAAPLNDIETMDKWLSSGMAWWNRGSKEWREEFLARIDTPVMDGGYPPLVPEHKATPGNIAEPAPRQEQAGTDTSLDRPTRVDGTAKPAAAAKEAAGTHPDDDWPEMPAFLVRTEQGRG